MSHGKVMSGTATRSCNKGESRSKARAKKKSKAKKKKITVFSMLSFVVCAFWAWLLLFASIFVVFFDVLRDKRGLGVLWAFASAQEPPKPHDEIEKEKLFFFFDFFFFFFLVDLCCADTCVRQYCSF